MTEDGRPDTAGEREPDGSLTADPATRADTEMPRHRLHVAARTDPGLIRANNEDSFYAGTRVLVVADGMGGHAAGEVASRLVVDAIALLETAVPNADLAVDLIAATRRGNAAIADMVADQPALDGMGTTVTAILFDGRRAALAHVGDSRAYLYRFGVLHQLTHDDTFVQSLVDEGRITEAQAHYHPQRNLVLRALTGIAIDPSVTIRETRPGDRYLICSDGLSGVVDAESIADALAATDPNDAADALIQLALAAGAPDNVTAVIADVTEIDGGATDPARAVVTGALSDDPSATNPIQQLTREMPRVPLPPIPEEPGAAAEIISTAPDIDDDQGDSDDGDETDEPWDDESIDAYPTVGNDSTDPDSDSTDPEADGDAPAPGTGAGPDPRTLPSADRSAAAPQAADEGTTARDETASAAGVVAASAGDANASAAPARRIVPRSVPRSAAAHPPIRRRWYRRGALTVAAAVLLAAGITGGAIWVRHQYFVSDQGNLVVIFRGVDGSLLGWHFSTFEETSCAGNTNCTPMKVSDLQPAAQNQVRAGIKATSLTDARDVVQRLSGQLLPPCPTQPTAGDVAPGASAPLPTNAAQPPPHTGVITPAAAVGGTHPAQPVSAVMPAAVAPRETAPATHEKTGGATHATGTTTATTTATAGTASPTAVTVTETVTATPLAPAPAVPGVTCRSVP